MTKFYLKHCKIFPNYLPIVFYNRVSEVKIYSNILSKNKGKILSVQYLAIKRTLIFSIYVLTSRKLLILSCFPIIILLQLKVNMS